jgi:O-antigen ligase
VSFFANIKLSWFYALIVALIIGVAISVSLQLYYFLALPLIPAFIYIYIHHPKYIWYFIFLAVPLSINVKDLGGGFGLTLPTEPIIILLFVGVLVKMAGGNGFSRSIWTHPITLLIGAELLWTFITSATSTMPLISFKYLLSKMWFVVVFYLLGFQLSKLKKETIFVAITLITITSIVLVSYTLKTQAEGSFSRSWAYAAMRPFLPDHGMYGAFVSFLVPPLLIVSIFPTKLNISRVMQVICIGVLLYFLFAVGVSYTRASWLSLAASFAVFVALQLKFQFKTLAVLTVLVVGGFLYFQGDLTTEMSRNKKESDDDIENHLKSVSNISSDPSNLERLNRWSCAYRMFLDKPVFGFGPGTYTFQYAPYQISSEMSIISTHAGDQGNVHSEYLRPLCESGLMGMLLNFALILYVIWLGFSLYYNGYSPFIRYTALILLLSLFSYYVHGFLNNYIEFDKLAVPIWSFTGFLAALDLHQKDYTKRLSQ